MSGCPVTLRTYSPVHIGTGNVYGSSEILLQGGGYLRLKKNELFWFVCEQKREEEFLQDMMSKQVRLDKYIRGLIPASLRKYSLIRHDPERSFPLQDMRECVKMMDVPYIPGSSLKGAIRTAVLWKAVCEDSGFVDTLKRASDGRRVKTKTIGTDYFARLLDTGKVEKRPDAKFDLLKFVEVSDMMPVSGQSDLLSLAGIVTYSQQYDGKLTSKRYQILVECIPSKKEFAGSISVSPQLSAALKNSRDYPRLEEKLALIGLSKDDPNDANAMVGYLKSVCSEFARAALKRELELCTQSPELCVSLRNCQGALQVRNLLRLGFGIGTGYQTIIHELIQQDADLAAAWISEMKLGKYPRRSVGEGLDMPYPKSVEFTTMKKPLGWIVW